MRTEEDSGIMSWRLSWLGSLFGFIPCLSPSLDLTIPKARKTEMSKEKERRGSVSPSLNTNCLQSTLRTKTLLRGAQPRAPSSRQLQGRAQSSMRQWARALRA